MDFTPIILSFKLAIITCLVTFTIAIPLVYFIHFSKLSVVKFLGTLINLPILLPPSVLGFYLLVGFGPHTFVGATFNYFNAPLLFSFLGLVVASTIYNLPFMFGPIQAGVDVLPKRYFESARVLGKGKWNIFKHIILPNVKGNILTAFMLTFAHTIGEFGVILMIGGSIPGKTRVASIAIYNEVEAMNYNQAHTYSIVLISLSILFLFILHLLKSKVIHA